ncbi:ABC transporter substrate-binding protein [Bradyrhizobium sp. dw_78]|uniref:ABC transporter substrate-binding protein n=1 Tax=Bradyrhizobium sp. dw_78 TaxID=2719793 RepID=UPI001BD3440B|nr:ABC transporter substrate-binding protein [Bradyrhizobium sp. dw_78]
MRLIQALVLFFASCTATMVEAQQLSLPIIVPLTGPLAQDGTAQRNATLLAKAHSSAGGNVAMDVFDTGGAPEGGTNALERVGDQKGVVAVVAPVFGTQVLPMLDVANELKLPMITVSGTAAITEKGSPFIFRYYPSDAVTKYAQAKYAVDTLGKKRVAILFNSVAYGQSGEYHLKNYATRFGAKVVFSDSVDLSIKDMTPLIARIQAAEPDVILTQLLPTSMALFAKQYAQSGAKITVVANTFLTYPSTTALLEPSEIGMTCAETSAWIGKGASPAMDRFIDDYIAKFGIQPDGSALQQYDGSMMVMKAIEGGAATAKDVKAFLDTQTFHGVSMDFKNDGQGNMAHSAVVVCFDGKSRTPNLAARFDNVDITK